MHFSRQSWLAHTTELQRALRALPWSVIFIKIHQNSSKFGNFHQNSSKFVKIREFSSKPVNTRQNPWIPVHARVPLWPHCKTHCRTHCSPTVRPTECTRTVATGVPTGPHRATTHYPGTHHYPTVRHSIAWSLPLRCLTAAVTSSPGSFSVQHIAVHLFPFSWTPKIIKKTPKITKFRVFRHKRIISNFRKTRKVGVFRCFIGFFWFFRCFRCFSQRLARSVLPVLTNLVFY